MTTIPGPFSTWSSTTPLDWDGVISDSFKPSDKLLFDLGLRWDQFGFQLMPMKLSGPDGLAYLGEETQGQCFDGFNYSPSDPKVIAGDRTASRSSAPPRTPRIDRALATLIGRIPRAFVSYTTISPRFGATVNLDSRDVLRFSVGRYVQPPNSAFEQYRRNPDWGPGTSLGSAEQLL